MSMSRKLRAHLRHAADRALNSPALRELDQVDWAALEHAHGRATDVPVLLRSTMSDDEDVREDAFELLSESIWHQGTVYSATPHAVLFLYRLLEADETPDKQSIVVLLATIADSQTGTDEDLAATRRAGTARGWDATRTWPTSHGGLRRQLRGGNSPTPFSRETGQTYRKGDRDQRDGSEAVEVALGVLPEVSTHEAAVGREVTFSECGERPGAVQIRHLDIE
jgi:hypothetical protein